ncbi:MAG: hypothetical protein ABUS79_03675 [Pseudomonadota bacterium]
MRGFPILLASAQSDGTALANTTTGASIIPASAKYTILPNDCPKRMRVEASGRISHTASAAITFEFRLGPTSNIIVATSPAFALNATGKTNVTWRLYWDFVLRSIGASTSATLLHTGGWSSEAVVGSAVPASGGVGTLLIPATAPAVGTGFDSTVANIADLQADWAGANASNTIQLHTYDLWDLGP